MSQDRTSENTEQCYSRRALTETQRDGLRARCGNGDQSMVCGFYEGCVIGCSADAADGDVTVDTWGCGPGRQSTCYLSPDEARREAAALLRAADWAEFGPGEWARANYPDTPDREPPELVWRSVVAEDGSRS